MFKNLNVKLKRVSCEGKMSHNNLINNWSLIAEKPDCQGNPCINGQCNGSVCQCTHPWMGADCTMLPS